MNRYLVKYFPIPAGCNAVIVFEEDELIDIINQAKPIRYQQALLENNYDPYNAFAHRVLVLVHSAAVLPRET